LAMFGALPSFTSSSYVVRVWVPTAPSVGPGTPIRKSGIQIGKIEKVEFASEVDEKFRPEGVNEEQYKSGVLMTLEIEHQYPLFTNEVCSIRRTLLGDAYVEFELNPRLPVEGKRLDVAKTLEGMVQIAPLQMVADMQQKIDGVINGINSMTGSIKTTSDTLNGTLGSFKLFQSKNKEELETMFKDAQQIVSSVRKSSQLFEKIFGEALADFENPELRKKFRTAIESVPNIVNSMNEGIVQLKANMELMRSAVEPLSKGAVERAENLDATLAEVRQLIKNVTNTVGTVQKEFANSEGTLGMLIRDKELALSIKSAIGNLKQVSSAIMPILDNFERFSQKLSDKGVTGVLRGTGGTPKYGG